MDRYDSLSFETMIARDDPVEDQHVSNHTIQQPSHIVQYIASFLRLASGGNPTESYLWILDLAHQRVLRYVWCIAAWRPLPSGSTGRCARITAPALSSTEDIGVSSARRKSIETDEMNANTKRFLTSIHVSYMKAFDQLREDMEAHGFKIYGVCAEYPDVAAKTKKIWNISYDLLGNPSNSLVDMLREKDFIDLKTTNRKGFAHGFIEPGLLFVRRMEDRPDVIFAWVSEQDRGKGAWGRPQPADSWEAVKKTMKNEPAPCPADIPRTTFGSLCQLCAIQ